MLYYIRLGKQYHDSIINVILFTDTKSVLWKIYFKPTHA